MTNIDVARKELRDLAGYWGTTAQFEVNNRITRTVGRTNKNRAGRYKIELSGKAVREFKPEAIIEVIRHEYAHVLAWEHDNYVGHGYPWIEYAQMLGCHPAASASHDQRVAATLGTA